jgi:hypothetical protein
MGALVKHDSTTDVVRRVAALTGAMIVAAACQPAHSAADVQRMDADSIVLERSVCFGLCPAYRLTLQPNGAVHFVTTARGDSVQRADTIAPRSVAWLASEAHRIRFYAFPREIVRDSSLCAAEATDHPTATVTVFRGDSTHTVIDYAGCYMGRNLTTAPALAPLRRFESAIDSVAGSRRWLDLARPR